jgi:hypothetical protein
MSKEKTVNRKRPVLSAISKSVAERGHMTVNEQVMVDGAKVKNALRRVNIRAFDGKFSTEEATELLKAMEAFTSLVEKVVPRK